MDARCAGWLHRAICASVVLFAVMAVCPVDAQLQPNALRQWRSLDAQTREAFAAGDYPNLRPPCLPSIQGCVPAADLPVLISPWDQIEFVRVLPDYTSCE
jgi:hypothetical protein